MKALILNRPGELILDDAPVPSPGKNELLIKTKAATICTSDIIDINENPFGIALPIIMGHEGAGVVAGIGEGVTEFKAGDAVAVHPVMPCGRCASCLRGLGHLCDEMEHLGFNRGGVFAEYFIVRADRTRLLPKKLSFAQGTLMEPVSVCIEAVERGNVREGCNVLVVGDGPFGIMISKLCKRLSPAKIILSGRRPYRLARAGGAVAIDASQTDVTKAVLDATDGEGIDSAIVCVNEAGAVDTAMKLLRSRGTLTMFSGITGGVPIDLFRLHVKELTVNGCCNEATSSRCQPRLLR